jgi:hypothetical protein
MHKTAPAPVVHGGCCCSCCCCSEGMGSRRCSFPVPPPPYTPNLPENILFTQADHFLDGQNQYNESSAGESSDILPAQQHNRSTLQTPPGMDSYLSPSQAAGPQEQRRLMGRLPPLRVLNLRVRNVVSPGQLAPAGSSALIPSDAVNVKPSRARRRVLPTP